jgi:hypothetical protein
MKRNSEIHLTPQRNRRHEHEHRIYFPIWLKSNDEYRLVLSWGIKKLLLNRE